MENARTDYKNLEEVFWRACCEKQGRNTKICLLLPAINPKFKENAGFLLGEKKSKMEKEYPEEKRSLTSENWREARIAGVK